MSDELHTVAHEIRWPSKLLDGADSVTLHGHNAIADYRAYVHKDATSRELIYKDDAERHIRELQAKLKEAEDSDAESLRMYRSARDRADELQARVAELERSMNPRQWTPAQQHAWHSNLPDVEAAFKAVASLAERGERG